MELIIEFLHTASVCEFPELRKCYNQSVVMPAATCYGYNLL